MQRLCRQVVTIYLVIHANRDVYYHILIEYSHTLLEIFKKKAFNKVVYNSHK